MHPEYIAAVKYTGVLKKYISSKEVIAIEKAEGDSEGANVVGTLRNLLKTPEWKNCKAQIVLSGDFTKFRVATWNDDLTQEEQKTRALHQLEEIYGAGTKPLHVFISDGGFRKNSLAFSIEKSFYNELLNLEDERLIRLNSMLPYFVLITNYWRKSIDKSAWLIIKENSRIYYAKFIENSLELIKIDPIKDNWELEAKRMLSREIMQSGGSFEVSQIYFHEEKQSNVNSGLIKNIHQNLVVLGHNAFKESNDKLLFASYLS